LIVPKKIGINYDGLIVRNKTIKQLSHLAIKTGKFE